MFLAPHLCKEFSSANGTDGSRRSGLLLLSSHFTFIPTLSFRETFSKGKEFFVLCPRFDFVIGHRMEHTSIYLCVMLGHCVPLIEKVGLFQRIDNIVRIDERDRFACDTTFFRRGSRQNTSP